MSLVIHECLPYEVFREILFQAALSAHDHDVQQTLFHRSSWPRLQESIRLSSVCWVWRQIVTSDRFFWLDTSFTNFTYPSSRCALDCMEVVFQRCGSRGFNCISLDFRSLRDANNAETIIKGVLDILLKSAPEILSSQWMELYLSAADEEHIDIISDYFISASRGACIKLSSITTLGVVFVESQQIENSLTISSPVNRPLPRFNTMRFPNITHLHLTNVYAFIISSNIQQCPLLSRNMMFEVWLTGWTCVIDDCVLFSDQAMPSFHLVTDSYMNFIYSSFCFATALTIHFPTLSAPMSSDKTAARFFTSTNISDVARFFLRNEFDGLHTLQLKNVTPRIWLAFLSLLKPLPSLLLAGDPFLRPLSVLPWQEIRLHLASALIQTKIVSYPDLDCTSPTVVRPEESFRLSNMDDPNQDSPLIKEIKERLGLPFDVEAELLKAANLGELQDLVMRCLPAIVSNLPQAKISFYSPKEESPLGFNVMV